MSFCDSLQNLQVISILFMFDRNLTVIQYEGRKRAIESQKSRAKKKRGQNIFKNLFGKKKAEEPVCHPQ